MRNKTEIAVASLALVCLLLFEAIYPYGFLYPYFHAQQEETVAPKKKRPIIIPPYVGLSPQKVADANRSDPTCDTYQRHVLYDSTNFFVIYRDYNPVTGYNPMMYSVSDNGLLWETRMLANLQAAPYAGGFDVNYPNRGAKDGAGNPFNLSVTFTTSSSCYWDTYVISGRTLNRSGGLGSGQINPQSGTIVSNLNGVYEYILIHRDTTYQYVRTIREPANVYDASVSLSWGGTATGGNQLLPYKTSSPYKMLALCKGGDGKLYWNIVNEPTATFASTFTEIVTLGTGFDDFCAASEAQNVGDPERVHLVYIKSTGELCYRKFENDAWSGETVLVASGASYPVIVAGEGGRLYVFYVKDGKIWLIKYDGAGWRDPIEFWTDQHTYNNPAYLSTNQNVQGGKICLVWTEGTASPYQVWFSYIEDT
jgi:hypothetical protein